MTNSTPSTRRLFAVAALAGVFALSACGSGGDAAPGSQDVASVNTGAAPSGSAKSTPGAADEAARPQRRLDTSDEEESRMWDSYYTCLGDNGVPVIDNPVMGGPGSRRKALPSDLDSAKYRQAFDKCEIKLPLMPPEMDPKKNPHYADDMHEWTKCMTARGVPTKVTEEGWTFTGDPTVPTEQVHKIEQDCKLEAFK